MLSTIGSIASQNQLPVWDKYNAITKYTAVYGEKGFIIENNLYGWGAGYLNYDWDIVNNVWVGVGNTVYLDGIASGVMMHLINGSVIDRIQWYPYAEQYKTNMWQSIGKNLYYLKGTLVQSELRAPIGTYPDNGRHTDGYWYVKRI